MRRGVSIAADMLPHTQNPNTAVLSEPVPLSPGLWGRRNTPAELKERNVQLPVFFYSGPVG